MSKVKEEKPLYALFPEDFPATRPLNRFEIRKLDKMLAEGYWLTQSAQQHIEALETLRKK